VAPFDPHDDELKIAPATRLALGRVSLAASEFRDEEVASEHLLIALGGGRPGYLWVIDSAPHRRSSPL